MIRTFSRLLDESGRRRLPAYVATLVGGIALRAAACILLVPVIARLFSDDPADVFPWVGVFCLVMLASLAVDSHLSRLGYAIGFDLLDGVQHRLVDHLGRLPLGWFHTDHRQAAQHAVSTSGPELVGLLTYQLTPVVSALLLPAALAVGLLFIEPFLGLAALVAAPVLAGARWASARFLREAEEAHAEATRDLDNRVIEFARTQRVLRAAGRTAPELSLAGEALQRQGAASRRALWRAVPGQIAFNLAFQATLALLAITTVARWQDGAITGPETVALLVVSVRFLEPFRDLADLAPAWESSRSLLRRLRVVLDAEPLPHPDRAPDGWTAPQLDDPPEIQLCDVRFGYDDRTVLKDVSLTAPAGGVTAIVGPSGGGKSTVLHLLTRFHDVDAGRVLVDGTDVRSLPLDQLAALFSPVFQDSYLVGSGTVRDSIAVGDPSATPAELEGVAGLAGVEEMVDRLPDGWQTRVGEGGTALSGGERQRVSIARALLKPAPVLLLDEATSGLDAGNEAAVVRALDAERGRRTVIMVAHRLETIRRADQILFLDDGQIVESGTPDDLIAAGGRFARYWEHRTASTRWTLRSTALATTTPEV